MVKERMEAAVRNPWRVTRSQIVARGLANRCPNCGNHSLFAPRSLRVREICPVCETTFDPGGGFWLGPWVINYTVTAVVFVLPLLVLGVRGLVPPKLAVGLAIGLGGFGIPPLLYRSSWSWWLMIYFFFFPHRLPGNWAGAGSDEME